MNRIVRLTNMFTARAHYSILWLNVADHWYEFPACIQTLCRPAVAFHPIIWVCSELTQETDIQGGNVGSAAEQSSFIWLVYASSPFVMMVPFISVISYFQKGKQM